MASAVLPLLAVLPEVVLKSMREVEEIAKTGLEELSGPEKKRRVIATVKQRLLDVSRSDGAVTLPEEVVMAVVPPMIEKLVAVQNGALKFEAPSCCGCSCFPPSRLQPPPVV